MPWFLQDVLYIYERLQISGDLVSTTLKHVLHLFGQVFFKMYFKSVYLNVHIFVISYLNGKQPQLDTVEEIRAL